MHSIERAECEDHWAGSGMTRHRETCSVLLIHRLPAPQKLLWSRHGSRQLCLLLLVFKYASSLHPSHLHASSCDVIKLRLLEVSKLWSFWIASPKRRASSYRFLPPMDSLLLLRSCAPLPDAPWQHIQVCRPFSASYRRAFRSAIGT